jgi:hypothetical protein
VPLGATVDCNTTCALGPHNNKLPDCTTALGADGLDPVVIAMPLLTKLVQAVGFTVYVPAVVALYVAEVAPLIKTPVLNHCIPLVTELVIVTAAPLQLTVVGEVITGALITPTLTVAVAVQPAELVPVTV